VKSLLSTACAALCLLASQVAAPASVGPITISGNQLQIVSSPLIAYLYVAVSGGGCTNSNAAALIMDSTNPSGNSMYATLLTAKTTGANISFTTSGCTSGGYPQINSVYLD
jgi:hypothetical protein